MPSNTVITLPPKKAEQTRTGILDAAARAFAEQGFHGANLREIGRAAGVKFQSISYHFGSKEQLWIAVVEHLCRHAMDMALNSEQTVEVLPPKEQLRAQIHALIKYRVEHPHLNRILMREAMKYSELYRKVYRPHVEQFTELARAFLARMQDAGVIKADIALDDLTFIFSGAINYRLISNIDRAFYNDEPITSAEIVERHAVAMTKLLMVD